jgi:hypothetical protein
MSQEGSCGWNGAATADKCTCSSNVYSSESHCWGGKVADLIYDGVDKARCTSGDKASVTVAKVWPADKDASDTQCKTGHDGQYTAIGVNYMIEKDCKGVADGQPAKRGFYKDSACTDLHEQKTEGWMTENACRCLLYTGCKKDTTFEKYWCAGVNGSVIAQEFSDSACTTATGTNRTITSVTDALNPGVCGAWPPIALKPNFDSSVILSCPKKDLPPMYKAWTATSSTPTCSGAADSGYVNDCVCKEEYFFNTMAADKNVQVSGDVTMAVSDVATAVQDVTFKKVVKTTVAETAGVPESSVVNLQLSAGGRRLEETTAAARKLSSGSVKASYLIVVPKAQETMVKAAVKDVPVATISSVVAAKTQAAGLSFTATVSAKSEPAAAPATVAVTTSGTIQEAGVTADGAPVGMGAASGSITASLDFTCMVAIGMASLFVAKLV